MNCIFLSRGKPTPMTKTVTLVGSFNSTRGYVTINGTKYTSAQALEIEAGTEISVYVASSGTATQGNCNITFNGETVLTGKGTYTFVASADTTIIMVKGTAAGQTYYIADITTS